MKPRTFDPSRADTTLFAALLRAYRAHGRARDILEDADRKPLTYGRLVLGALVLGDKLSALTRRGDNVGVLLPNAAGMVVTLFGLNAFGRVAALLNFTAGAKNLRSAVQTARIRTVLTSRRFIGIAKLEAEIAHISATPTDGGGTVEVVYLEDVRGSIGTLDKIRGAMRGVVADRVHRRHALAPDEPAVVLFTSGTEGVPKGVVLTNRNLVANAEQIFAHADGMLSAADTVLNPLPMFHSFGLTAGTLMPLLNGMRVVLYPSPLHYKEVPKLIGETKATVLFATDTFLQGYGRAAASGDLASVRYVVAGAERVKDHTREMWAKYGTLLLEGYGATECSPVISCNLPASNRPGSVGPLLPGIEARLEPVPGIQDGGRLLVKGPNVMAGYMLADNPGVIVPPAGGWHDTGDIVTLGEDRFIEIKGRARRFAKIAGEMVSLAAVESMIMELWPDSNHVCVALPDPRKGEQLTLVTDKPDADKTDLLKGAQRTGFSELWVPRTILVVDRVPVLGSGKIDFASTLALVQASRPLL